MFKREIKKKNGIKKLLLKLFKIYGFDKENFNLINPNTDNISKNYYKLNDKTYILSNGYLDLKRKISQLDIFFRYSPTVDLWNSSGNWKRIVPNITKETLIENCLKSLKESIIFFLNKNKLKINLHLIHDGSSNEFNNKLLNSLDNNNFGVKIYKSKIEGNRGSYLECCDQAIHSNDLIMFVEDDYLFEKYAIEEMIFSYSRISTLLDMDIFLCPSDYPFYYDSAYKTALFVGKEYRWRYVGESLLTILFSKKNFTDHINNIRKVGLKDNDPFEKPLHEVYKQTPCLAPVKSIAYHLSRSVPAINEDWLQLWNSIYKN